MIQLECALWYLIVSLSTLIYNRCHYIQVLSEVSRGINRITLLNSKQANSLVAFSACGSWTISANSIRMTANLNDVEQSVYLN